VPATAFVVLASMLLAGIPFAFDRPVLLAVHGIAGAGLDRVAWWLARVGYGFGVIPFDVVLVVVLAARHRWRDAGFAVAAFGGSLLMDEAMKSVFARTRPTLWIPSELQHTFGFPSGHAMACATLVVVVTALAWRGRSRWPILLFSAAFALMVGASRVYVGVHYPSDVLAGWCAGVAWAMAMRLLVFRSLDD
jgi:membrane-associated phospholipid phosphatase